MYSGVKGLFHRSQKVKGTVVLMRKNVLDINSITSVRGLIGTGINLIGSAVDGLTSFLGRSVCLQLISATKADDEEHDDSDGGLVGGDAEGGHVAECVKAVVEGVEVVLVMACVVQNDDVIKGYCIAEVSHLDLLWELLAKRDSKELPDRETLILHATIRPFGVAPGPSVLLPHLHQHAPPVRLHGWHRVSL
ncbi:Seed linoleate 9S-lipoxygenase-3 [Spatholobus suberectus]|nr:Seed linoleate 9S-lipoxygenase-3 [Spatholobus suberectus]